MTIAKPLLDVCPADQDGVEADPRPPCLPDFVIAEGATSRVAVIETMGFANAAYRARKLRVHGLMSRALDGARVIMHDFHEPAGWSQVDRDRSFWRSVRWQIAGCAPAQVRRRVW